jgi:hypothetical protein
MTIKTSHLKISKSQIGKSESTVSHLLIC